MDNLLHMTAIILLVLWAISFFALSAGPVIHLLLLFAVITILLQAIRTNREYE